MEDILNVPTTIYIPSFQGPFAVLHQEKNGMLL